MECLTKKSSWPENIIAKQPAGFSFVLTLNDTYRQNLLVLFIFFYKIVVFI